MSKFTINDLMSNKVQVGNTGSGQFALIRERVSTILKMKGEATELSEIVKTLKKEMKMKSPQQTYNYVQNALKSDNRFYNLKLENGRRIVVRTDGDQELITKLKSKEAKEVQE